MKDPLPALLILADSPDALTDLCGISLLERLRRIVRKLGFGEAMSLSNSVEIMARHAGQSSWYRGEIALKFHERETEEVTIGDVLDCIGATTLPPDGRVLIVSAGFYYDERLLRVLAEAQTESVLIDSDPPSLAKSFWETSDIQGFGRLPCALLLSREWLIGKDRAVSLRQEVASEAVSGRIASVDAAQQPGYVRSMRGNIRPVFFPAPSADNRALAERLLQDATQKHVLDYFLEMSWWTALAHHFQVAGQVRHAYVFLLVFVGADAVERLARRLAALRLGRKLDDASRFDRVMRYIAGRRNIYTWLFAFSLLIGMPAAGFVLLCCWGIVSSAIQISRAIQIRGHVWR